MTLFAISFLAVALNAQPVTPLQIDHDVQVGTIALGTMLGDRFTWQDSNNKQRVAGLAHNDGMTPGPGGSFGGELREFRYDVNGVTRIVAASSSGASGFGYVVSHPDGSETCIVGPGIDSSSLGHFTTGTFTRVFEGKYHAIFRFTQQYPRYCQTGATAPAGAINVPVTIDWVFVTGHDNPLWAVTYDMSAIAQDTLNDDARAPYGELLFDGAADEASHSVVAGVSWGDRYKFFSTVNPVTMNSPWTWNDANTIPYVKLWTTAVDATMGTVQTQPITQQDAGGYFETNRWNTTSAAADGGNGCALNAGGDADQVMPCDFNWPFQSINYSLGAGNATTKNTRLAWGTNFGFLGQAHYHPHGSTYWGGPIPDVPLPGYPRESYSTYVVLGQHTLGPVEAQVTQVETIQSLGLSINNGVGAVITVGPAGVNRPADDTVMFNPPGYNHVYGALAFAATGNKLDANVVVGAGTLAKPLIILYGYNLATAPGSVKLDTVLLTPDVDYFASVRTDASELWITLNKNLSGQPHRIEINGPVSNVPGAPAIGTATPERASALIAFTAPASNGGSAITGYIATCNPGAITGNGAGSPVRVSGLTNGTHYTCSVAAMNVNGTGPSSGTVTVTPAVDAGRTDFDGNGTSDIVLMNTSNGQIAVWQMSGFAITAGAVVGGPGLPWTVVATGDFNGDGHSDILLQNTSTGDIAEWQMNGPAIAAGALISSPGSAWKVAAVGDFNGDGRSDILLQNTNGQIAEWTMNGFAITAGAVIGGGDPAWQVIAAADLNGDGKSDVVLQNTGTGDIAYWQMNGGAIAAGAIVASPGVNWKVVGAGDLDGDGKADLVLQNSATGDVAGWLMNGSAITAGAIIGTPGTAYTVLGVADYNGDGRGDLLLRNSAGDIVEWQLNGLTIAAGAVISSPGSSWKPVVR